MVVLLVKLIQELLDEHLFLLDNLSTSILLGLNFLYLSGYRYILANSDFSDLNPESHCGSSGNSAMGTYLIKFLAVFFLLEFLPVPVDLNVLLVG